MTEPEATIVITSYNRQEYLRKAVTSALEQEGSYEILVVDDASSDGSAEMVRKEFPEVTLSVSDERLGLIVQRNRAARRARAPIVVNIDDDILFSSRQVMKQVIASFDHPRIGAVAIPHINFIGDRREPWFPALPDPSQRWITRTFAGGASANRRDVFLALGGFHEYLFHWGEEPDYCLRLLQSGRVVRVANSDRLHHYPVQAGRHTRARNVYINRNRMLAHWYNAPSLLLAPLLARESFVAMKEAVTTRNTVPLESCWRGWCGCVHEWRERHAVDPAVFSLFMELRKKKLIPLAEVEGRLPELV